MIRGLITVGVYSDQREKRGSSDGCIDKGEMALFLRWCDETGGGGVGVNGGKLRTMIINPQLVDGNGVQHGRGFGRDPPGFSGWLVWVSRLQIGGKKMITRGVHPSSG